MIKKLLFCASLCTFVNPTLAMEDNSDTSSSPYEELQPSRWQRFLLPLLCAKNQNLALSARGDWYMANPLKRLVATSMAQQGFVYSLPLRPFLKGEKVEQMEEVIYGPASNILQRESAKQRATLCAFLFPFLVLIPTYLAFKFNKMKEVRGPGVFKYITLSLCYCSILFLMSMGASYPLLKKGHTGMAILVWYVISTLFISVLFLTEMALYVKKGQKGPKKDRYKGVSGFFKSVKKGFSQLAEKEEKQTSEKRKRNGKEKAIFATVIPIFAYLFTSFLMFWYFLSTNRINRADRQRRENEHLALSHRILNAHNSNMGLELSELSEDKGMYGIDNTQPIALNNQNNEEMHQNDQEIDEVDEQDELSEANIEENTDPETKEINDMVNKAIDEVAQHQKSSSKERIKLDTEEDDEKTNQRKAFTTLVKLCDNENPHFKE